MAPAFAAFSQSVYIKVLEEKRMAKTALVEKHKKEAKYKVQEDTRYQHCGRLHAVLRKFRLCRICFRELAYNGQIPGVKKASWQKPSKSEGFLFYPLKLHLLMRDCFCRKSVSL